MSDAPMYLPEGYKKRVNAVTVGVAKTGQVSNQGTVTQSEHWDGSMDATVKPQPVSLSMRITNGAPPNPAHVHAVAHLEKALRRLKFARVSGDPKFLERAETAVAEATRELEEAQ